MNNIKHRLLWVGSIMAFAISSAEVHAQSLWNAGVDNWFTPGNWTPNGVPTNTTDVQVNNSGTAQIGAAGAVALTVRLGNGVGETGHLEVTGPGTLTTNAGAGFFLIVGEAGTGTLAIPSGGSVSAPVIYFGDLANSTGTGTVSGVGSVLSGTFDIEVGRSGSGTLNILNGGSVTTSVFNVGNGTGSGHVLVDGTTGVLTTLSVGGMNIGGNSLGSTGEVTVTGSNGKFTATNGVGVGSAGDGTFTVSAGATGQAASLLIGDAGTGTVMLTGTNTTFTVSTGGATGTVTVGNVTTGNLNIEAGAVLTSDLGVIGKNPGGIGTVTITGAGSSWSLNQFFTLVIGQSGGPGGRGILNILNGGKFSAANLNAFTDATIKVDGAGSQLLLPNDFPANKSLFLGSTGVNKLDVTGGGKLATGSALLTTTATSSLAVNLAGAGSTWTQTQFVGTLTMQFGGAGTATFTVADHAVLSFAQDGFFNVDATGAGTASLKVSGGASVSVGTTSGTLRIGENGTGSLTIDSGGIVNTATTYVGENTGAVGSVTVSGAGSTWNAGFVDVGTLGGHGTVDVSGGAAVTGAGELGAGIVPGGTAAVTLSGAGTKWIAQPTIPNGPNDFITVGTGASLVVQTGALVNARFITAGGNGIITIQNPGTQAQSASSIETNGTGALNILDGAVINSANALLGALPGSDSVTTVDGAATRWTMTNQGQIGLSGKATLNIQNGAKLSSAQIYLGFVTGGNGVVNVIGAGSSWDATGFLRVADWTNTFGTFTISQGGTVTSVSGAGVANFSGIASTDTANGSLVVTDASSKWTNTGDIYIGKDGTVGVGALTVVNSGTAAVSGVASINANSALNIGTGGVAGAFSAASVANSGQVHFNHTGTVTFTTPIGGTGVVNKDGSGTTILTGTNTYTGATNVNAGTLRVDGTLGNTAVTVASGATLGGTGSIAGAVTIQNGGILAPGASPGTITIGTLTLNNTSQVNYDLGAAGVVGGPLNDLTIVNGNLVLDGVLNITDFGGFSIGTYRLFNYTGALTDNTLDIGVIPAGFNVGTFSIQVGGGEVNLVVAAAPPIPEQYWDGPNTVANNAVDGGTSTWNNVTTNWTNATGSANGAWQEGVAIFSAGAGTITLGDNIAASELRYLATSGAYTVTAAAGFTLTINGVGITNNSGLTQNFIASGGVTGGMIAFINGASAGTQATYTVNGGAVASQPGGAVSFQNSANAGSATFIVNGGAATSAGGGTMDFRNASTARDSTITNNAGTVSGTIVNRTGGGSTVFHDMADAGKAIITNNPTPVLDAAAGSTFFRDGSTAATSHITNNGGILINLINGGGGLTEFLDQATAGSAVISNAAGAVVGAGGGTTDFLNSARAGNSTITAQGGSAAGTQGGLTFFDNSSLADTATLINQGGTGGAGGRTTFLGTSSASGATLIGNGGTGGGDGGSIEFFDDATGGTSAVQVFGNGQLDISAHHNPGVTVGSLEGSGNAFLGANNLTVGSNDLSKIFSGAIQDGGGAGGIGGSFTKIGAGTLDLTGTSTYTGATSVNGGILRVNGSLTATSQVTVNSSATLGGAGTINAPVTVANGGTLAPGNSPGTLTMGALTLNSGSLLNYELATPNVVGGGVNDLTIVNGNLTLDGILNITGLPGFGIGTYRLFNYTGSLTDNTLLFGTVPGGFMLTVDTSVANQVNLDVAGGGPLPIAYWNGAHTTANGVVNGGSAVWDNTTTNWTNAEGSVNGTWGNGLGIFGGQSAGTVTLGANVSFTGLEFSRTGYVIEGAGFTLNAVGPAAIVTDANVSATINVNLVAPQGLTKLGTGSLYFDGSLLGNMAVLRGLLGGDGSITGNLYNAATVSPGHSPGRIRVSGNYTQTSTGLLRIEIGGRAASRHDLLSVGGTADLDGTLQLVRLNKFKLKRNQPVTFLTAAQGIDGEFATVISDFPSDTILVPTVIYRDRSVALEAVQGSFLEYARRWGLTPNQKSVARGLDTIAFRNHPPKVVDYLDNRKLNKLPGDFDKIAPEELTSIFTISTALQQVQSLNLRRRTDDIRAGSSGFSAGGLAVNGSGPGYSGSLGITTGVAGPSGYEGKEDKELKAMAPVDNRWGAFLSGTGEWVNVGDTDNARGYDLSSGGFTLGIDYKLTQNFAIGIAAGYVGTIADLADRGRVWVNGGKLGLYATAFSGGWYADAAVFGGYNSYDTRRSGLRGDAHGSSEGGEINALLGTGYDFKLGSLSVGPTATFNYTYTGLGGFSEHGSLAPLSIHGGDGESLRSAFGIRASFDWKLGGVLVKPEISAAWQHEFGDAAFALDSGFAHEGGGTFAVNGPRLGRDSALLGAGFAIQVNDRLSTYLDYDGELGRRNYHSASVSGGVRLAF